ncbi:MAG: hypothetical protein MRZ61_04260 [Oscillospiraceae bacterium]|nr:hypothetical protein [Oscillospiraceae bacterium]
MTEKGSISQAENRVKEMNRMTRQLLEQSNRAFRQNTPQNMQREPPQSRPTMPYSSTGTRFEQMNRPMRNNTVQRPNAPPPMPQKSGNKPCESAPAPKKGSGLDSLFSGDGDTALIVLIIVLLIKEKADMKLILALGYLLI